MKLLDISSIENGLSKIQMEPIDFSSLVESIINKTEILFENYHLETAIKKNIQVSGNAEYLEQAIKNYISNALSHTDAGKTITIRLHSENNDAVFTVCNEGAHIQNDDLAHIWDSFYRSDKSRTRQEEVHAGLGLYIVKTVIEAHKGTYGAKNMENSVEFYFKIQIIKHE
ncbi:Sensor histidine kinase ResE [bioreactor metagenome]|uniref:histidine kinase n=1 Tax=bioreactor metagenome TaxID=1076179 RepID=A0A645FRB9_9ZZZZ